MIVKKCVLLLTCFTLLYVSSVSAEIKIRNSKKTGWVLNGHQVNTDSHIEELNTAVDQNPTLFSDRTEGYDSGVGENTYEQQTYLDDLASNDSESDTGNIDEFQQHNFRTGGSVGASNSCSDFSMKKGLLTNNLVRFLDSCGYTVGQWRLGDDDNEYDMVVPKGYVLPAQGLSEMLTLVEETYLVRGTINTLDKTVDFEPSRGAIFKNMEINKW